MSIGDIPAGSTDGAGCVLSVCCAACQARAVFTGVCATHVLLVALAGGWSFGRCDGGGGAAVAVSQQDRVDGCAEHPVKGWVTGTTTLRCGGRGELPGVRPGVMWEAGPEGAPRLVTRRAPAGEVGRALVGQSGGAGVVGRV